MEDTRTSGPDVYSLRKDYTSRTLDEGDAPAQPMELFEQWLSEAISAEANEPNAMNLATIDESGYPHSRIVLLREFNEQEVVFYTNYTSSKGKQMQANPQVAICFFWPELERQVRIEGLVQKLSAERSDAYFNSRPLGSRIGAWVSPQSEVIASRNQLDDAISQVESRFGENVPRPDYWGGYAVRIKRIEFWQGRASRLHDRINYAKADDTWQRSRLAP